MAENTPACVFTAIRIFSKILSYLWVWHCTASYKGAEMILAPWFATGGVAVVISAFSWEEVVSQNAFSVVLCDTMPFFISVTVLYFSL